MRVRMLRTIDERDAESGEISARYPKGSVWNVSDEHGERLITQEAAKEDPDVPIGTVQCFVDVISETDTCIIVEVGASPSSGEAHEDDPAQVRLESLSNLTQVEGAERLEHVTAPARWRFEKTAGSGVAMFRAQCTGFVSTTSSKSISANPDLVEEQ